MEGWLGWAERGLCALQQEPRPLLQTEGRQARQVLADPREEGGQWHGWGGLGCVDICHHRGTAGEGCGVAAVVVLGVIAASLCPLMASLVGKHRTQPRSAEKGHHESSVG